MSTGRETAALRSERLARLAEIEAEIVDCVRCPRLVAWRELVAREKRAAFAGQAYWGRPIPGFGDPDARVMILGLAPAAHGANRTGRVFTGDRSATSSSPRCTARASRTSRRRSMPATV